jgi:hypothetical protein
MTRDGKLILGARTQPRDRAPDHSTDCVLTLMGEPMAGRTPAMATA